jgi:hypothetical protein
MEDRGFTIYEVRLTIDGMIHVCGLRLGQAGFGALEHVVEGV